MKRMIRKKLSVFLLLGLMAGFFLLSLLVAVFLPVTRIAAQAALDSETTEALGLAALTAVTIGGVAFFAFTIGLITLLSQREPAKGRSS